MCIQAVKQPCQHDTRGPPKLGLLALHMVVVWTDPWVVAHVLQWVVALRVCAAISKDRRSPTPSDSTVLHTTQVALAR